MKTIQLNTFSEQEDYKTNKLKSLGVSTIVYAGILLTLYLLKISYEPKEEIDILGVDLNYGVDLVGSGDLQTLNKANPSPVKEEMMPDKGVEKPVSAKPTPAPAPKEIAKPAKANVITADEDTKVTASKSDNKTKTNPTPVSETKPKVVSPPAPKPVESKPAPPARNVESGSIMKKNPNGSAGSNGTVGNKAGIGGNNNGDGKKGEVGDKGDPRGTLDGKSLYGNPGKGGGASGTSVSISGWKNKGPLNIPKDGTNEAGIIKFRVTIDDFGDVQRIDVIESSLSPSVTNYYKSQITKRLKSNLIPEGTPPPMSKGTITINITRG
jgi:periplasmic protein TonB